MHVVVGLLLVAACGFQAPPPDQAADPAPVDAGEPTVVPTIDAPTAPAVTPQALLVQMVTLECQAAFACKPQYPASARPFDQEWGTDLNDCVTSDKSYRTRDSVAASCASGVIAWDPVAAQQCFSDPGIPTSCSVLFADSWSWDPTCLVALAGRVPDGGACQNDWECAGRYSDCRSGTCMQ